jgi:hypothetical protein
MKQYIQGPLYQIDCAVASSGKKVSVTKRRIRWRFGFADQAALQNGETSVDCRGREHEITFIWSITSGKRLLIQDGQELHYSMGRRTEGKFQLSWPFMGNHVITMICYVAPPLSKKQNFNQYELLIDGKSFYELPRIYELGTTSKGTRSSSKPSAMVVYQPNPSDDYAWARNVHQLEMSRGMNVHECDSRQPLSSQSQTNRPVPVSKPTLSIPDLISDSPHSTISTSSSSYQDLLSATNTSTSSFTFSSTSTSDHSHYDEFAPKSQAASHEAVWASILDAYDMARTPTASPNQSSNPSSSHALSERSSSSNLNVQTCLPLENLYTDKPRMDQTYSPTGVDAVNALGKLVNLDNIAAPVLKPYNDKENAYNTALEAKMSLNQIKSLHESDHVSSPKKKEVMRNNHLYNNNGGHGQALVVYGQPNQAGYSNYGMSMHHQPMPTYVSGFGVGASYRY